MFSIPQRNRRDSFILGRTGTAWLALCLVAALVFSWRAIARSDGSPPPQVRLTPISLTDSLQRRGLTRRPLKSIEQIQVGERVALAENPAEPFDDSLGADVDPATWRMIRLRAGKSSGGHANVALLRPQWWINERLDPGGPLLTLSVPEVGIHDNAEVLSVEPCPPISGGRGRVVIGTFAHEAPALVDLHVEGLEEPIRCTPDHPTWSYDRQAFIKAQDFEAGERLQGDTGLHRVIRVVHVQAPAPVFNLEVHGQHVYQVSALRLLVHNAPSSPGRMQREVERGQAPRDVQRVDRGHIDGQEPHVHYTDGTSSTVSGGVHDAHRGYPNPSKAARRWLESHEWTPPPRP